MNEINLRDLFSRVHNGDQEAFGHVYQQLSQPVYTICWRITQSKETAEDITHDVFVKLYSTPPDNSVRNIRAWIFQMAHNMSIDALRRNARSTRQEQNHYSTDAFERLHVRMDLETAFTKLSSEEREILALHLNGQLNFKEIARIVNLSMPAAYRKYRKALKKIQTEMNGG